MKLLVVAGEVSGDQHVGALLDALALRVPDLSAFGLGGERCAERGVRLVAHQKDLAIIGVVEAISKLRFARRVGLGLVEEAVSERVDAAVLVDSPDFNLPLARRLAARGIPVVFYVSPQVWAWRARRARKIVDRGRAVLTLFGFEKRWYDERGLGEKVTWVGHPLVDEAARELAEPAPRPPAGRRRVVVMPGSREGEVRKLLPTLRRGVELLRSRFPDLDVLLVRADPLPEAFLREAAGGPLEGWSFVSGPHLAALAASDLLLVASGTATLEGLLAGVPSVVVYRLNPVSYWLGRLLVRVPHIGMANLVSDPGTGERAFPELLQGEATPENIAAEGARFLSDPRRAARCRELLAAGRADLGPPGAAERAAEALLRALGKGGDAVPATEAPEPLVEAPTA